jgi:DNA polymerase III subunit gamma/tau
MAPGGRSVPAGGGRRGVSVAVAEPYGGLPEGPTDFSPDDPVPAAAPRGVGYEEFEPGDEPLDEPAPDLPPPMSSEEHAITLIQQALGAQTIKGLGA